MEPNSFNSDMTDTTNNTLIQKQLMECHYCYLHLGNPSRVMSQKIIKKACEEQNDAERGTL